MRIRHANVAARSIVAALLFGVVSAHAARAAQVADTDDRRNGYLVFNTFAHHFEHSNERDDFTPGIGWEYSPTNRVGFHVGTLSDSVGSPDVDFGDISNNKVVWAAVQARPAPSAAPARNGRRLAFPATPWAGPRGRPFFAARSFSARRPPRPAARRRAPRGPA